MVTVNTSNAAVRQFIKFLIVGVINTLVTLIVIFVCKSLLGVNQWVSNAIGYVAGVINSFLWNKQWVFHSSKSAGREACKFMAGFLICYGIQFFVTWFLTNRMGLGQLEWQLGGMTFSGYAVATVFGMCVYTICNFIFNRIVTFK